MTLVGYDLVARMAAHKVPGVSLAIVEGDSIVDVIVEGVIDAALPTKVTPETLFQVASITKPMAALLVLQQVRDGDYTLETPVNDLLLAWHLPENRFTQARPVTVRDLLAHISGIAVPTFHGYPLGGALPDLVDVLEGRPPATSEPVEVLVPPGKEFRYSSGGYCVLQQLIEDRADMPFAQVLHERLLRPLGMRRSTLAQPPAPVVFPLVAHGHAEDGSVVPGGFRLYPEMAAAGLWSTPGDLALLAIELQRTIRRESDLIISPELLQEMLQPQKEPVFGLGFALYDKGGPYFGHMGTTEGYRSLFISHRDNGKAAVLLTNSAAGDALNGELINTIAHRHQWQGFHW